jgi:hypothetical protein
MLPPRHNLLCYGHDYALQLTRRWVLEREFRVRICQGFSDLTRVIHAGPVDALVLCHSVSNQECRRILPLLHEKSPHAKTLMLLRLSGETRELLGDAYLVSLDGPAALLKTMHALLAPAAPVSLGFPANLSAAISINRTARFPFNSM